MWDYLAMALSNPASALLVSAERALAAEFPSEAHARTVLRAIGKRLGGGNRAYATFPPGPMQLSHPTYVGDPGKESGRI